MNDERERERALGNFIASPLHEKSKSQNSADGEFCKVLCDSFALLVSDGILLMDRSEAAETRNRKQPEQINLSSAATIRRV